jgi:hypothetical protein
MPSQQPLILGEKKKPGIFIFRALLIIWLSKGFQVVFELQQRPAFPGIIGATRLASFLKQWYLQINMAMLANIAP